MMLMHAGCTHGRLLEAQVARIHVPAGLWPEFAMLNHSCVPNTIPVLIGDRLVVRAAVHIPEGGEVRLLWQFQDPWTSTVGWSMVKELLAISPPTLSYPCHLQAFTSYLGTQGGTPVSERTRALQATYGFHCNCARCKVDCSGSK
jgi:hypothetical protein